jgi:hypothetical protein
MTNEQFWLSVLLIMAALGVPVFILTVAATFAFRG